MATFSQRNVQQVLVGGAGVYNAASAINTLAAGEVAVFTPQGVRVPTVAAATLVAGSRFKVAVGTAGDSIISDVIDPANVSLIRSQATSPALQQIDHIGFNGTAGSEIEVIDDNLYFLEIYVQEYLTSNTDGRKIKHAQYLTGVGESEMNIAQGLASSMYENFFGRRNEADQFIRAYAISAAALASGTTTVTGTNGLTFTQGSTVVADLDDSFATDGGVVGDYIRLDIDGGGEALTDPVYQVIEINTGEIILNRPYVTVDEALNIETAAVGDAYIFTQAAIDAAAAGVELVGQELNFQVGKFQYGVARWELNLLRGGDTFITKTRTAFEGYGVWQQVSELEWFTQGHEGEYFRMGEPAIHPSRSLVNPTGTYDMYEIVFSDVSLVGFQNNHSPKHLSIADDTTGGDSVSNGDGAAAIIEAITGLTFQ